MRVIRFLMRIFIKDDGLKVRERGCGASRVGREEIRYEYFLRIYGMWIVFLK